jgi:hypothetical protein
MALIEFQWVACLELINTSKSAGLVVAGGDSRHPLPLPNPQTIFFFQGLVAPGGAANHPHCGGATRLGAVVGSAGTAGVIRNTPAATKPADFEFFIWLIP